MMQWLLLSLVTLAFLCSPAAGQSPWTLSQLQTKEQAAAETARVAPGNGQPREDQIRQWFEEFKGRFGKGYSGPAAENKARVAFRKNIIEIYRKNADSGVRFVSGPNEFSDMDFSELQATMLMKVDPRLTGAQGRRLQQVQQVAYAPITFTRNKDWRNERKVTAVRNQASCGSCYAFVATAALESAHLIVRGGSTSQVRSLDLAEQELVSCSLDPKYNNKYNAFGCAGGGSDGAMQWFRDFGITTEAWYSYTSGSTTQAEACSSTILSRTSSSPRVQLSVNANLNPPSVGYVPANVVNTRDLLRRRVDIQPVAIYIQVTANFGSYAAGAFVDPDCTNAINHGLLIVGYLTDATGTPCWLAKNSWGTTWGQQGYICIAATGTDDRCGVLSYPHYPSLGFVKRLW